MDSVIVDIVQQLGLAGIAILMALENIFPPMPSEAIMGAAGLAVHHGRMNLWAVVVAGTLGTLVGNYFWFWIGDKWGYERLGPFIDRWGRWLTMEWEDVENASRFFRKHGHWVVFLLRTTPIMRTMISLPAGLAHMNWIKFSIFTAAGAALWNILLVVGTGWLVSAFPGATSIFAGVLIAIAALSILAYIWRLVTWKPRSRRD
ncbi:DedA family protein [Erythrobacter sp. LQ02-29]|uniref:DedA family protein n=1 Tax=Erythrobacter sp. LQ02-29 TaxID=2920384 RepID=UPI001F4E5A4D|nr:DedA family protein [Erythrobacter sp. LQ02-29]MCP9223216.1 DedA family protein [Erythrobacter sp. LQ02-29]